MKETNKLTLKIKTREGSELSDEQIVDECMAPLMEKHAGIYGYSFMRSDDWVYIFIFGEFEVVV